MNYILNIKKMLVNPQALRFENPEMSNGEFAKLINRSPQNANSVRVALNKNLSKIGYTPEFVEEAGKNPGWFFIDLPDLTTEEIKEISCYLVRGNRKLCDITIENVISHFCNGAPKSLYNVLKKIGAYSSEYHNKAQRILMISEYPMNFIFQAARGLIEGCDSYTSSEEVYRVFDGMMGKLSLKRERSVEIIEEVYKYHTPTSQLAKKYGITQSRVLSIIVTAKRLSQTEEFDTLINALNDNNRHGYINFNDIIREIKSRKEEEQCSEFKVINGDTPLEELDLSCRSYNCLKRKGMENFEDVCNTFLPWIKGEDEAPRIHNFGDKCYDEVRKLILSVINEEKEDAS